MAWHHAHFPTFHQGLQWYLKRTPLEKVFLNITGWGVLLLSLYALLLAPPPGFMGGVYVDVPEGMPLRQIAQRMEDKGVVTSARRLEWATRLLGDQHSVKAGYYFFSGDDNLVWVAMRLLAGDLETEFVRVTIPEGSSARDIAKIMAQKVPEFNVRQFLDSAREGYLFPDTYFFRPGVSTEAVVSVFENTFRSKIARVQQDIRASGRSLEEILIMASILEKEASKTEDRQRIAGVLWHRINIGMPLQVDATFPYYLGRNTFQVTLADLKTDHPYNTYTNKGLPPGPISNPGLDSILAAARPIKSNYVFFLSDRNGNFHYAVTYEQHMVNKRKYLD